MAWPVSGDYSVVTATNAGAARRRRSRLRCHHRHLDAEGWVITAERERAPALATNILLRQIPAGVPLEVTGETNGWLSVVMQALPGGIGWISGNYVVPYSGAVVTPY
jgi:hypothetical protein